MNQFRHPRLSVKLGLVVLAIVAGALGIVYAAVVPRLEDRLVDDRDVALRDVAREVEEALPPQLGRRVRDREPAQVERDRAQRGRGQRDLRPRDVADLEVAGEAGGRLDRHWRGTVSVSPQRRRAANRPRGRTRHSRGQDGATP